MKNLIIIAGLLLSANLFAQTRGDILRSIRDLSYQVENETYNTQANQRELQEARRLMQQALDKLTDLGGGDTFLECRTFVFPILDRTMTPSDALNEAIRLCRNVEAVEEMKYLYSKYDRGLTSRDAITRAARVATGQLIGKLDLLRFAYEKYDRQLTARDAADRAVQGVSSIPYTRSPNRVLNCFQSSFPIYDRTMPAASAMDETIKACRTI